jgi:crotonobetainyl-CoA:carnitine CoA-transferase CaiB-like acyl-CoA transferase
MPNMVLLDGFRVAQMGRGLAAAVCGRMLADLGAAVGRVDPDRASALGAYLNHGASEGTLATADLIVCEGSPAALLAAGHDVAALRRVNATAAIVLISPFGQTGPRAEEPASDLTLFLASGIARMLTGQVDDLNEAPMAPVGQQSAFLGGLAAACAGMHAALLRVPPGSGAVIDVSIQEALATLAMTELARAGQTGRSWSRKREGDGNGATVCILPASDGYAAISPREDKQWT